MYPRRKRDRGRERGGGERCGEELERWMRKVCVCVCERAREREKGREREIFRKREGE